ncbi:hypothetical protein [Kitasatospora cheerisanensis]|uniref:Bulb-type lectin domain-containing protein n=1 Tax=Kitasatospora cheerisanensis KCTC 2395 TaxID=1348663 RepID=A0A066ZDN7_9ACTN|nr:hypothetical protein [Kitasatospora cheerisanensis]KDN88225.1 hypothetical protein KCH_00160 [Kitasatospora cheerisanensis KCTC 2395]
MQADGNRVLTHRQASGRVLWSTGTSGNNGAWAYLQPDGNLVVHKKDGNPANVGTGILWASNTYGQNGAFLLLQAHGDVSMMTRGSFTGQPLAAVPAQIRARRDTASSRAYTGG